jgi:hypothetical protein
MAPSIGFVDVDARLADGVRRSSAGNRKRTGSESYFKTEQTELGMAKVEVTAR